MFQEVWDSLLGDSLGVGNVEKCVKKYIFFLHIFFFQHIFYLGVWDSLPDGHPDIELAVPPRWKKKKVLFLYIYVYFSFVKNIYIIYFFKVRDSVPDGHPDIDMAVPPRCGLPESDLPPVGKLHGHPMVVLHHLSNAGEGLHVY